MDNFLFAFLVSLIVGLPLTFVASFYYFIVIPDKKEAEESISDKEIRDFHNHHDV